MKHKYLAALLLTAVLTLMGSWSALAYNSNGTTTISASGGGLTCPTGFTASGANQGADCYWTQTANNTATNLTFFPSGGLTLNNYDLVCSNLIGTASGVFVVQFGTSTGPTWDTTAANYVTSGQFTDSTGTATAYSTGTYPGLFPLGAPTSGNYGANDFIQFTGLQSSAFKVAHIKRAVASGATMGAGSYSGFNISITAPVSAIRVIDEVGGNIVSGSCTMYSHKN